VQDYGVDVVCLGILVADVIARPAGESPPWGSLELVGAVVLRGGGCALNTSTALVKLGLTAGAAGKVGADPFGDFLLGLLDERGIDRRGVVRDSESPTSATAVLVRADGERAFLHSMGADGTLAADELDSDLLYSGKALHVAGALVMETLDGEPTADILAEAKRRGVFTSLDPAWDPTGRWSRLEPCLPHLDLAVPSLGEAQAVSGEQEPQFVAAWWRARGVKEIALTMGPEGCYAAGDGFEGHVPAPQVQAIDGTGAGDAFAAGLIYGKLAGWSFRDAVTFASAAGALATTAVGATEGVLGLDETLAFARMDG
jgi:sugar/nucleoside kinase (ribokinase family)